MSTLSYYENYLTLATRIAELEGLLQFNANEDEELLYDELQRTTREMRQIESDLTRYIPFDLPPRIHYAALEEREFLFYRCIKGLTMMQTADLMRVSRDTVYRIKRRLSKTTSRSFSFLERDIDF